MYIVSAHSVLSTAHAEKACLGTCFPVKHVQVVMEVAKGQQDNLTFTSRSRDARSADMALAALRAAIAAGRSGVSALTGSGHISAAAAVTLQTRGLSSHSENTNVFIREVRS
jgi:hypothetical protein